LADPDLFSEQSSVAARAHRTAEGLNPWSGLALMSDIAAYTNFLVIIGRQIDKLRTTIKKPCVSRHYLTPKCLTRNSSCGGQENTSD